MIGLSNCRFLLGIPSRVSDSKFKQWIQQCMLQRSSVFFFWERVALSLCSTKLNILNSFSGGYITDEWTRLHPDLISLPLEDENKIISRIDHKVKRNVMDIYAGILRLWFFMLFHKKKLLFWHSMKLLQVYMFFWYRGVRGITKVPAKALFGQPRKSLTFVLTFLVRTRA